MATVQASLTQNCSTLLDPHQYGYFAEDGTTVFSDDLSLESTYIMDKLSCSRTGYFLHVIFCWCVFLTGLGAMVSRVWAPAKWTHKWWGRLYAMFMLWTTGTSMIIHNSGLPMFTLKLFLCLMIALPLGWFVILLHQKNMQMAAVAAVQRKCDGGSAPHDLDGMIAREKGRIAERKDFRSRFLSKKSAHGFLMVLSWFCVAGRIPFSFHDGEFTCHTYPVYKPINYNHYKTAGMSLNGRPLQLLPLENSKWREQKVPWMPTGPFGGDTGFTLVYIAGSAAICVAVGLAVSWYGAGQREKGEAEEPLRHSMPLTTRSS